MLTLKELIQEAKKSAIQISPYSPLVKEIERQLSQGGFDVYEVIYPKEEKEEEKEKIEVIKEKPEKWAIIRPEILDIVTPFLLLIFIFILSRNE